jgi:hypothetical protein
MPRLSASNAAASKRDPVQRVVDMMRVVETEGPLVQFAVNISDVDFSADAVDKE